MTKNRHAKPDEFHKEIIRNLRKELKRKDQEIKRLQKELGYNQNKPLGKRLIESLKEAIDLDSCPDCGKGILKIADLGIRTITTCSLCSFRKVSK